MKLKTLMKKIETANGLVACVGYRRICVRIEIDGLPLSDVWRDSYRFYDWNHVAASIEDGYIEEVQNDFAKMHLHRDHLNTWKIYGKSATIVITVFHE